MALTLIDSNTQAAAISTEHTLSEQTVANTYVLVVDTAALALGDIVELRIYTKVLTGGTARLAYMVSYANLQGQPNKYSVPVPANIYFKATLKQVLGTGRSFPWALLAL